MSSMQLGPDQKNGLLFVGFNQDYGCFACGTDNGFRIYNVSPFQETFCRIFANGGIGIVEMLFRCNLLALVGGGRSPRYPPHKVMIWDDNTNRCIGELSFRSEVKAVKLRRDRVVVVLQTKIYVYRFSDLHLMDQMNTLPNPRGLVALCPDSANTVLACPGINKGHVRVELYDIRKSTLIPAHESELAQIALNADGSRLATASDKGTLLRVFDTTTGELLHELRRGMDRAEIFSIAFNQSTTFLACSSDKGTVHIFTLGGERSRGSSADGSATQTPATAGPDGTPSDVAAKNTTSGLSFMRSILPGVTPKYFGSEWSFAQIRGLESKTVIAFGSREKTIITVGADGSFMESSFAKGGDCERVSYTKFLRGEDEEDEYTDSTPPAPITSPGTTATRTGSNATLPTSSSSSSIPIGGGGGGAGGGGGGAVPGSSASGSASSASGDPVHV